MGYEAISTNNAPSTSSVVASAPLGTIADNDVLVALSTSDSATSTPGFDTGFVQPTGSPQTLSSFDANRFAVAIKVAASESGDYTQTSTGNACISGVVRVSGRVPSTTPHRISAAKSDAANPSPQTITSAAFSGGATTASCTVLVIAIVDGTGSDSTFTPPAGYTLAADICQTATFERQFMVAYKDSVAAGFDGILSASAAGNAGAWAVYVIALATQATCALTGTATAGITEADIVAGGKTIIATLSGDTYVPASGFESLTFVGDAKNAGPGNADLTVDLSAISMQQGDLVLVAYGVVNTADHVMAVSTSGYTELFEDYADDTRDANGEVAYKIMGATPDTSVVLTNPGALATNSFVACVQVWRGVDQTTPIDATTTEAEGTNSSVSDSPSITTVTDNALVVSVGINTGAAADTAVTSPTGYTNQTEHSTDPGTSIRVMMASKIVATAGAENPAAWGGITTTTSDSWLAFSVALRPAATTPFADAVTDLINGFDSAQSEATGWDAVVKAGLTSSNVARTSDTVATITLPAFASYDITAIETITGTIPASILSSGSAVTATPTITVATASSGTTGTGSLAVAPSISGTGFQTEKGSGSLAVAVPSLSGSGKQTHSGSGSLAVPVPSLSGTGTSAVAGTSGTGSLAVPVPSLSASGIAGNIGSGALAVSLSLSGTGVEKYPGSGSLAVPVPSLAGTGSQAQSGSGSLAVAPSMAGTGNQAQSGSGSLAVSVPSMSGLGGTGDFFNGTGSLAVPIPSESGSGTYSETGTAGVALGIPILSGSGLVGVIGDGSAAVTLSVSGIGFQPDIGTGSLAVSPVLAGTGTVVNLYTGSGALVVSILEIAGTGRTVRDNGSSHGKYKPEHDDALKTLGPLVGTVASGQFDRTQFDLTQFDVGHTATGSFKPEHDGALVDAGNATGFSADHADALRTIAQAGI